MEWKRFEQKIAALLQEKLGSGYQVDGENGKSLKGMPPQSICVRRKDTGASLVIKMDGYCGHHIVREDEVDSIASRIAAFCEGKAHVGNIGLFGFTDWETVKSHIYAKLVNTERNRGYLAHIPHREFLDLSLVYHIRLPDFFPDKRNCIPIREEYVRDWDADGEMLYQAAMENMQAEGEPVFESLGETLRDIPGIDIPQSRLGFPLYVLGSQGWKDGAVQICRQEIMERVAGFFKSDFWILPSSVHEVLLLPAGQFGEDAQGLAGLVKEVNDTHPAPEEILSYHVYRYTRLTGEITVAA